MENEYYKQTAEPVQGEIYTENSINGMEMKKAEDEEEADDGGVTIIYSPEGLVGSEIESIILEDYFSNPDEAKSKHDLMMAKLKQEQAETELQKIAKQTYHTSFYSGAEWDCCGAKSRKAGGCKKGAYRHHMFRSDVERGCLGDKGYDELARTEKQHNTWTIYWGWKATLEHPILQWDKSSSQYIAGELRDGKLRYKWNCCLSSWPEKREWKCCNNSNRDANGCIAGLLSSSIPGLDSDA